MSKEEWHDFSWGMIYGVGLALTFTVAFAIFVLTRMS